MKNKNSFTTGNDDSPAQPGDETDGLSLSTHDQGALSEELKDLQVHIGTLLKTETVSFFLGAGASYDCGGLLIGSSIPLAIEQSLVKQGVEAESVQGWLKVFYLAVRCFDSEGQEPSTSEGQEPFTSGSQEPFTSESQEPFTSEGQEPFTSEGQEPFTSEGILARRDELNDKEPKELKVNFEQMLSMLYRWRSAFPATENQLSAEDTLRLSIKGLEIEIKGTDLDECLSHATKALAVTCDLPANDKSDHLEIHKTFIKKILTRPLNLKRANIFTLNYDTLVEQAADAAGVVLLDGFVGTQSRVFRPESYEQDLYFPAETTEGRVQRFDRVLHLYKLHGSITWIKSEPEIDNPYGVKSMDFASNGQQQHLIYPLPTKYGETLGLPYSELFRRFANAIVRPQSVLFVIGYGFGDDHVNAIIRQALSVPSFTLVIVSPSASSDFVEKLRSQNDPRILIVNGEKGCFKDFVEKVLPNLRDEEIRKKVLETHRALKKD